MSGVLSLMLFMRPLGATAANAATAAVPSTINENFATNKASKKQQQQQVIRAPQALAIIRNGNVVGIKLLSASDLVSPTFYNVVLTMGTHSNQASPRDAKVRWNKDNTFTVIDPGSGYITPPIVNFIPRNLTTTKEKGNKKKKTGGPAAEGSDTVLKITPSGMWEDIPQNEKDALAEVTQDYLREQKYSGSVLENMYTQGVLSRMSDTSYSVEWMYPIEFSMLVLNYNQLSPRVKLIKVVGYNENGVELFSQDLIYKARIEWRYRALLKKLVVSGAPRWDSIEVWGRRVFWTCEEYQDFVEQLKESTDKPGTSPSSQYEDDDTTVLYSEVLEQVPPDFRDKTKSEYIDYYSTMASHCNRKTKEQQDAEKLVEDQEIANYQKMIQESQEKTSLYKEKLMRDYQRMQEQYALDEIDRRDAEKYGISPPEFKYSKEEIESLRKRIESIKNVPEEKLLRDCSRLEKTYNKQRKSAEKWAKAGIFLPFLKKKAKRESKKAEKSENRYQENCAELVALSYSY